MPPFAHVELVGQLPVGCSGKDVIIALCGFLNEDQVLNHAVEFGGEGVASLDIEDRLTIANMSTEWGALCGLFPIDGKTLSWWSARAVAIEHARPGAEPLPSAKERASRARDLVSRFHATGLAADTGADYAKHFRVDLGELSALVTGGNTLKHAVPAGTEKTKIHKAWLVSCVNARASDIAAAAKELRGRKVAPWVELYVAAASSEVQAAAECAGDWQVLLDAGAIVLPPGCGACAGLGAGTINAGEVGIAATNRNFKGRMGSRDGIVHLASPAVVAASAAEGYIVPPTGLRPAAQEAVRLAVTRSTTAAAARGQHRKLDPQAITLVAGFPEQLEGDLFWCGADNISTDGIYHARHMYEDLSKEEMADVAMENYDPAFRSLTREAVNPILAAGSNFGAGSSREQAAQCLKYLGIVSLLAGSYSATYTRNALNNGLPIFESPELMRFLQEALGSGTETSIKTPTVRTGCRARLDLVSWRVTVTQSDGTEWGTFPLVPIGAAAQELLACGGLTPWIKKQLAG